MTNEIFRLRVCGLPVVPNDTDELDWLKDRWKVEWIHEQKWECIVVCVAATSCSSSFNWKEDHRQVKKEEITF